MQSQQPHNDANNEHGFMDGNSFLSVTSNASKRMSMIGGKRMNDIKRSLNTMIHKGTSARDSMLFLEDPAVTYTQCFPMVEKTHHFVLL
jgi:hypothetical protein